MKLRFLSIADLLTLGNAFMGFAAIVTLTIDTRFFASVPDELAATAFIIIGLALDGLDGMAARRFGSSPMGKELDSLSDVVTFCVAPGYFLVWAYHAEYPFASAVAGAAVVLFGMLRLARFGASPEQGARTFTGLPTPLSAAAIVFTIIFEAPAPVAIVVALVVAFLNLSHVPYPKARERAARIGAVLIATALVIGVGVFVAPELREELLLVGLVLSVLTIGIAPIVAVRRQAREAAADEEPPREEAAPAGRS